MSALSDIDEAITALEAEGGVPATKLREARAAMDGLIKTANRAAIAAVRGDGNKPGTIRNADLDALRAAIAHVQGGAP